MSSDIVDGLVDRFSDISQEDGWELGTGTIIVLMNYLKCLGLGSMQNQFQFLINQVIIKALRKNDNLLKLLNWKPKDQLSEHIKPKINEKSFNYRWCWFHGSSLNFLFTK